MERVLRLFRRTAKDEQGITGLETAIILIAFVVVATIFAVATTAGGEAVPMNPSGNNNRTVMAYRDHNLVDNDVAYTVTDIVGDSDSLLEPGELKVITIDVDTDIDGTLDLDPNEKFTLEVQTPVGATLDITRQLPSELRTVMQLH
jgi:flagellin-like protein